MINEGTHYSFYKLDTLAPFNTHGSGCCGLLRSCMTTGCLQMGHGANKTLKVHIKYIFPKDAFPHFRSFLLHWRMFKSPFSFFFKFVSVYLNELFAAMWMGWSIRSPALVPNDVISARITWNTLICFTDERLDEKIDPTIITCPTQSYLLQLVG